MSRTPKRPQRPAPARPAPRPARPAPAWLVPGLLVAAALAMQGAALGLPFFADDYLFLDQARGRGLFALLASPDPLRNFWRPVGRQLYFWIVSAAGESPVLAHALNLLLFGAIVALLFTLVRRLAGVRAAAVAAAFLALHSTADVPVRWSSGSQDLIAVALALLALVLASSGRRIAAAVALLAGLLAKETVLATPLVAAILLRRRDEPWPRALLRAWPGAAAVAVWAVAWLLMMHGRSGGTISFGPAAIPAAVLHLLQAGIPAEWSGRLVGPDARWLALLVPGALALVAVGLAWGPRERAADGEAPHAGWREGLAWAALATVPVILVAPIWSAYYYLFATCGLALALGAALARAGRGRTLAALGALALASQATRSAESFTMVTNDWGLESHLNRFYFDRSMTWTRRYLEDMKRQRPTLPHRSTVFFSGTRSFSGWQAADGPLVRWAYRDSSLRSYYFDEFTLAKAARGPLVFFVASNDSLVEQPGEGYGLQRVALGELLSEQPRPALDAMELLLRRTPGDAGARYWAAWLRLALGDRAGMARELTAAGFAPQPGPAPEWGDAQRRLAAGDTRGALRACYDGLSRHALDPRLHAALARIYPRRTPPTSTTVLAIYAWRLLAPDDPEAWREWAHVQFESNRVRESAASMERYLALVAPAGGPPAEEAQFAAAVRAQAARGGGDRELLRQRPAAREAAAP